MPTYATKEILVTSALYGQVLPQLIFTFRQLESLVPAPTLTPVYGQLAYRFSERSIEQALLLKFARVVTGVQAIWSVLQTGLTQEAAALQRIMDELGSDIMFLAGPLTVGQREPAHDQFLADFYQEEFDEGKNAIESEQRRNRVPRKKIRAYNARTFSEASEIDKASAVQATIDATYSGFVHAAGAHTMDTYGGDPPSFHVEGMHLTTRLDDAFVDFRNYLHRALVDAAFVAKALGQDELFVAVKQRSDILASKFGLIA